MMVDLLEVVRNDDIAKHPAVDRLVFFGVKSGCVILEVLDERTRLGPLIEDFGLAFIDAPAAIHWD